MRSTLLAVVPVCGLMIIPVTSQGKEGFTQGTGESRATVTVINGNPLRVNVGSDHSFQIFNASIPGTGQIFPAVNELADFGWILGVSGTLYAPDFRSRASATTSLGMTTNFTEISVSPVTGNGEAATPFTVTVSGRAGPTLTLTQVIRYVNGENFFRKQMTISNTGAAAAQVRVFLGADLLLAGSDSGRSRYLSTSGSVGGSTCEGVSPPHNILLIPQSPAATAYTADSFSAVWSQIGSGSLPSTASPFSCFDNGAALQWNLNIPTGGSAEIRAATSFGEVPTIIQPPAANTPPVPGLNAWGAALLAAFAALSGLVILRRAG